MAGSSFGMGGSDYYGDLSNRMPYTGEMAPRPIGVAEVERSRAMRRAREAGRAKPAARQCGKRKAAAGE